MIQPATSKRRIIIASALLAVLTGIMMAMAGGRSEIELFAIMLASVFLASFLQFWWFQVDRKERGLRRSAAFNIGLASFAIAVGPAYLYRTRAPGKRLKAMTLFLVVVPACWYALLVASTIAGLLVQGAFAA